MRQVHTMGGRWEIHRHCYWHDVIDDARSWLVLVSMERQSQNCSWISPSRRLLTTPLSVNESSRAETHTVACL